jgi:hypothetical protein
MAGSKTSKKSGSKTTKKRSSAKQKSAQNKFKKMIIEAKRIRKAHPDKKWQMCIKEAAGKK